MIHIIRLSYRVSIRTMAAFSRWRNKSNMALLVSMKLTIGPDSNLLLPKLGMEMHCPGSHEAQLAWLYEMIAIPQKICRIHMAPSTVTRSLRSRIEL